MKKEDLPPELAVSGRDNSNLRVMIGLTVSKLGVVGPFFVPQGVKLGAEKYQTMLEQQYSPAMSLKAIQGGLGPKAFYFQQDNCPSRRPLAVEKCIKKNAKMLPKWPARSCDLAVLGYFVFNQAESYIGEMPSQPKKEREMRTAISLACANLDQRAIDKAIDQFPLRLEKCLAAGGLRFEHTL